MKKFKVFVVFIIAYLLIYFLQVNFFSWFNIDGVKPNLFLLLALFIGIFSDEKIGTICGFCIGIYTDFLFSNSLAVCSVLMAIIGYCGRNIGKRFSRDNKATIIIISSIVTAIYELIVVIIRGLFFSSYVSFFALLHNITLELLYNAILIIIFYPLIRRFGLYIEEVFGNKKMSTRYF